MKAERETCILFPPEMQNVRVIFHDTFKSISLSVQVTIS